MDEANMQKRQQNDVTERYCPKLCENVVMLCTHGVKRNLKCMNYDTCEFEKGKYCGSSKAES